MRLVRPGSLYDQSGHDGGNDVDIGIKHGDAGDAESLATLLQQPDDVIPVPKDDEAPPDTLPGALHVPQGDVLTTCAERMAEPVRAPACRCQASWSQITAKSASLRSSFGPASNGTCSSTRT